MGTVDFSIPEDVRESFNAAFEGRNKSAIVKWSVGGNEPDLDRAAALLRAVAEGVDSMLVPVHFEAEVAAVLAREMPRHARAAIKELGRIDLEVVDDGAVLDRAVDLALRLDPPVALPGTGMR